MDVTEVTLTENPYKTASLLSKCLFLYLFPLIIKGYKVGLHVEDMYDVRKEEDATRLGDKLSEEWSHQSKKTKNGRWRLVKALWNVFVKEKALKYELIALGYLTMQILMPIFLRLFIESLVNPSEKNDPGFFSSPAFYMAILCILTVAHSFPFHHSFQSLRNLAMRCSIACSSLIYRKTLRLSNKSLREVGLGQITNMLSNDVRKFDENFQMIPYIINSPLQLLVFAYLLWDLIGVAGLMGTGIPLMLLPLEYWISKLSAKYRKQFSEQTGKRGSLMDEVISGIRIIKMYAFETPFTVLIDRIRKLELNELKKKEILVAINLTISQSSARLFSYFMFLAYLLLGNHLNSMTVFFTLSIMQVVVRNAVKFFSLGGIAAAELVIIMDRMQAFLLLEEQQTTVNTRQRNATGPNRIEPSAIIMENISASWTDGEAALRNVTANLQGPKLVFIVGPVGSGKSALLSALIAELPISYGKVSITGSLSYASQEAWLFAGTIRQNILCGQPMDSDLYQRTVRMCCLEPDLDQLPHRDLSVVGARGVILSGGQKARVNLARAVYKQADIYLLDDPLSAVDPKVGRELFQTCIRGHLSKSLTVVVTHQTQFLADADHIIVLNKGEVLAQGSYEQLQDLGLDLHGLLTPVEVPQSKLRSHHVQPNTVSEEQLKQALAAKKRVDEGMASGYITYKTYLEYFKAAKSPFGVMLTILTFIIAQVSFSGSDYWLSYWTHAEDARWNQEAICVDASSGLPCEQGGLQGSFYFQVYTGLLVLGTLTTFSRVFLHFKIGRSISRNLHNLMFSSVVRAPTKFFDENPCGRMMNRFVNDLGSIDDTLPMYLADGISGVLVVIGMLVIVVATNLYMIFPTLGAVLGFYLIQRCYLSTSRDVKRIEAVAKSPMFSHLAETIQGIATLRSSSVQKLLISQFDYHQNRTTAARFIYHSVGRWLGIWIEIISTFYLTVTSFSLLYLTKENEGSYVGLAIYSILSLMIQLQWVVRITADTENQMTAVERVLEYCKLGSEAPLESSADKRPPQNWPENGEIRFENVSLSYGDHPVLKNLTFDICSQEKIGIVGRTGAGKSSVVSCLFRLVEYSGDILIDGIPIKEIGLHDLRKNISIIPQDPFLFSGTLRYNLDPFGQFGDDELFRSLEDVELKDSFPNLDYVVDGGGKNFSVGQRQLVCLARAILRNNKIIVMDEATANIDQRTDTLIQTTTRRKFADRTIVTIAHRLQTIMDCDRILVLDNGSLVEYGNVQKLLQNSTGTFSQMVSQAGNVTI